MPVVTKARIIRGMTNLKNRLKRADAVTTIRFTGSGAKAPGRMPTAMPVSSLPTRPIRIFIIFSPCF
jgi:hypothetical protein